MIAHIYDFYILIFVLLIFYLNLQRAKNTYKSVCVVFAHALDTNLLKIKKRIKNEIN